MKNQITLDGFLKRNTITEKLSMQKTETLPLLPQGWKWVKLGDVCKISAGGTPKRSVKEYWNGDIPWVKISDIPENGLVYKTKEKITKKGLENSSAKIFPKNTILFTIFATIGRVGFLCIDAATNQAIAGLRIIKDNIDAKYLFYCLRLFGATLLNIGRGAAQYNINQTILKRLMIPVPSLDVQRRVVARIEELMSRIEQAKKLREEALKETEKIMQTALHQIFSKAEEKGWKFRKISEIAETTGGGTPRRSVKEYYGGGIPWVKSGELEDNIIFSTEETITEEGLKNSNAKLLPKGTLLVAMYGATVGKTGILGIEAATNQAICAIFPKEDIVNKFFIRYFIIWKRQELIKNSFGGAQPNISQRVIRNLEIPTPPLEEQKQIVEYLDKLNKKIELLKQHQNIMQKDFENITKTVLKMAFSGRL